jgi:hypothetical protein
MSRLPRPNRATGGDSAQIIHYRYRSALVPIWAMVYHKLSLPSLTCGTWPIAANCQFKPPQWPALLMQRNSRS